MAFLWYSITDKKKTENSINTITYGHTLKFEKKQTNWHKKWKFDESTEKVCFIVFLIKRCTYFLILDLIAAFARHVLCIQDHEWFYEYTYFDNFDDFEEHSGFWLFLFWGNLIYFILFYMYKERVLNVK